VAELTRCGLTSDAVERRARTGRLHRMHQGVYAVGHPNPPLEGRFLAAVKASTTDAALSHFSGAAHWEMVDWGGRRIEVVVPRAGVRSQPGLRVHRTKVLEPRDVVHHRGIPVTSPARTLIDLSSVRPEIGLRRATSRALSLRLLSMGRLVGHFTGSAGDGGASASPGESLLAVRHQPAPNSRTWSSSSSSPADSLAPMSTGR